MSHFRPSAVSLAHACARSVSFSTLLLSSRCASRARELPPEVKESAVEVQVQKRAKAEPKSKAKAAPKPKSQNKRGRRPTTAQDEVDAMEKNSLFSQELSKDIQAFAMQFDPDDDIKSKTFKAQVRFKCPDFQGSHRLNIYWTRASCGITVKYEDGSSVDMLTFSFNYSELSDVRKVAIAIRCATHVVSRIRTFKPHPLASFGPGNGNDVFFEVMYGLTS